jgi:hypothetical protein
MMFHPNLLHQWRRAPVVFTGCAQISLARRNNNETISSSQEKTDLI